MVRFLNDRYAHYRDGQTFSTGQMVPEIMNAVAILKNHGVYSERYRDSQSIQHGVDGTYNYQCNTAKL